VRDAAFGGRGQETKSISLVSKVPRQRPFAFPVEVTHMSGINFCMTEFLATDPEARVRFPALPGKKKGSRSGTGSTRPREYN
jgi:hypothetical protein